MFGSALVCLDLFPISERVVARTALLPFSPGARLTLLHVVPTLLPPRARQRAEGDARKALDATARKLAHALPKKTSIQTLVKTGTPATELGRHAQTMGVELLVMGRVGGRPLRELFIGSTAERVIRQAQLPVLVVRLPARSAYRRPVVALDFDEAAEEALAWTLRMLPPPRPPITLVHAYNAPYHGFIYPSLSTEESKEYRRYYRRQAVERVQKLLAILRASGGLPWDDAVRWTNHVSHGSPRTVIPHAVDKARADLLVLGTHGRSGVAQAFLGTVAGDVLREVSSDVLVVPHRDEARAR